MELSLLQWFFQGIPENLVVASLAIVLVGRRLEARNIIFIGLNLAIVAYLVRLLPLAFGVHFIIFIVALAILLNIWLKVSLNRSLLTSLAVLIILAVAETVFVTLMQSVVGIPFEEVRQDLLMWVIYGWPHIIFIALLTLIIERRKRHRVRREELNA